MIQEFAHKLGPALALCLAAIVPSAFGQSACPQPAPAPATDPVHTIIPVHFDVSTGNITVGSTTYCGQNPGFHLLALQRQPDSKHLDAPDMVWNQTYTNAASVNNALQQILNTSGGPIVMINAVGSYGIALSSVAQALTPFGAYSSDLQVVNSAIPFVFIGNGGRNPQTALQRGLSTNPLDGELAQDSNGNYTFTQMDFVRYDLTTDGTIKIGNTTYPAANAGYKYVGCDAAASNSFHLVVVNRESPSTVIANNAYCTRQNPAVLSNMATDLSGVNSEGSLVFIATNGHPIPADWNFGTDGDARVYPLARQIARLGGYWETMVYLTPNDTFSLVGAPPPPAGVPNPRPRARESSSVYPADVNGKIPTGELHGELARGRANWYSPLNAEPSDYANLGLYEILAQAPVAFPHPANNDEIAAFNAIMLNLCQYNNGNNAAACASPINVRNQYGNLNISIGTSYQTPLQAMSKDAQGNDCTVSGNANLPYCLVRAQLLNEFTLVSNIRALYGNVTGLWSNSGTVTLYSQLSAYDKVKASLPQAPGGTPAPSLMSPLVNLFLGLAGNIPEVGPVFGLADLFFNFGTSLTTDTKGNQTIDLTSTIGQLEAQASQQFIAQGNTTGTLFEFLYQDWGKLDALGTDLALASGPGSPWYWSSTATSQMLQAMAPAVQQGAYQSIMPAAYAIGSYLPQTSGSCYQNGQSPVWGQHPLWQQPRSYVVLDVDYNCGNLGNTPAVQPFAPPCCAVYIPYTYPNDPENPIANDTHTGTMLADGSWLGISSLNSPSNSGPNQHYDPPDLSLLSNLFTPVSQGGLGVYRPAFFEGWPFSRVTCTKSFGDYDGYEYVGGCNWSAANPVTAPPSGPSVTSLSMQAAQIASNGNEIDVRLTIFNNGTVAVSSINLDSITLRTLAGSGQATLLSTAVPIQVSGLVPGDSTDVILTLNIPTSVVKLGITETGSAEVGGQSQPVQLSEGQAFYPQR